MENVRLIHSVDKLNHLRTLVTQDIKQFGVKVPKSKKIKKLNQPRNSSQDGLQTAGIFGNYLTHVPSTFISSCGFVPTFLVDAANIIKESSVVEGIFRKSGSISRQKELRQQVEDGHRLDSNSANIHDITGLIKQFFRELPEPLFTSTYHDCFVRCYQLPAPDQVEAMLLLCLLLPPEHLSTLRFTMGLLSYLADQSKHNKMDCSNLAVVLAPNIMHVNSRSQKMNSTEEKLLQVQTSIVELLIIHAERIGVVSESLFQRTWLMTECFGTEDEVDCSDDNTLEDNDIRKKRRKRSSSLQGLVSSIGRGLSKLRRSTEGRNVTASSTSSCTSIDSGSTCPSLIPLAVNESLPPVTPVIRKRKASTDNLLFSSSKKKAILEQLPYGSALGGTPFTPASACKAKWEKDLKANAGTPSFTLPEKCHLDFPTTPTQEARPVRKRLGLLTPSSSKKNKRHSTACSKPLYKSGKAKHLLKRLSGSKDKDFSDPQRREKIGERLASPPREQHRAGASELRSHNAVMALPHMRASSPLHDASNVSSLLHSTLNLGFTECDDALCSDIHPGLLTTVESSLSLQARLEEGGCITMCTESCNQGDKTKMQPPLLGDSLLRRGQPNTITSGLLRGDAKNLNKLRRSLDRSAATCGLSAKVSSLTDAQPECMHGYEAEAVHAKEACETESCHTIETRSTCGVWQEEGKSEATCVDLWERCASAEMKNGKDDCQTKDCHTLQATWEGQTLEDSQATSASDLGKSACANMETGVDSCLSITTVPHLTGFTVKTMLDEADSTFSSGSETAFSTISGETVIYKPLGRGLPSTCSDVHSLASSNSMTHFGSRTLDSLTVFQLQPSTSVDSLISCASDLETSISNHRQGRLSDGRGSILSSGSEASVVSHGRVPVLERTCSIDSGKGSMLENEALLPDKMFLPWQSNPLEKEDQSEPTAERSSVVEGFRSSKILTQRKAFKSMSDDKLQRRAKPESSHSHLDRHFSFIPNLQISAETHRLLTRAGFLQEGDLPHHVKDVPVPLRSPQKSGGLAFHRDSYRASWRSMNRLSVNRNSHACRMQIDEEKLKPSQSDLDMLRTMETDSFAKKVSKEHSPSTNENDGQPKPSVLSCLMEATGEKLKQPEAPLAACGITSSESESSKEWRGPGLQEGLADSGGDAEGRPKSILKHAELQLQKHSSIAHIKEAKAGHVAANIRTINNSMGCSSSDKASSCMHGAIPSTCRRGMSPVRIPSIFAKGSGTRAHNSDLVQKVTGHQHEDGVPMAKIVLAQKEDPGKKETEDQGISAQETKAVEAQAEKTKAASKFAVTQVSLESSSSDSQANRSAGIKKSDLIFSPLGSLNTDLSSSLMESIEEVVTPRRHRHRSHNPAARPPLSERTNRATAPVSELSRQKSSQNLASYQARHRGAQVTKQSPAKHAQ